MQPLSQHDECVGEFWSDYSTGEWEFIESTGIDRSACHPRSLLCLRKRGSSVRRGHRNLYPSRHQQALVDPLSLHDMMSLDDDYLA